jgi:hypothetical protein
MRLLFLTLLFSFHGEVLAQFDNPHFMSLNLGTNLPLSEYKEVDSLFNGGANEGLYFGIEGAYFTNNLLGLGANLGIFLNPLEEKAIQKQVQENLNNVNHYSINGQEFFNAYAFLGPYVSVGSQKIRLDLKLLVGYLYSQKPSLSIKNASFMQEIENSTSANLSFNYGAHLRIKLSNKVGLRLNAEAISCEQEFENSISQSSRGASLVDESMSVSKLYILSLNLGAGLIISL